MRLLWRQKSTVVQIYSKALGQAEYLVPVDDQRTNSTFAASKPHLLLHYY